MSTATSIDTRLHPVQAFRAVRRLIAAPDDTGQVFIVLQALRGRSGVRLFRRFAAEPTGAAVLRDRRCLLATLRNHAALARLAEASLGRAYLAFMTEEELSADALAETSQQNWRPAPSEDLTLFRDRQRDSHDLGHVLTGYGRDPLGELCLLAFNYAQSRHLGMAMIVLMGLAKMPRGAGRERRAVLQAWRAGRRAAWLAGQDWEARLRP
jgi:ubiquinone biosynthesis protein COQ4